MGVVPETFWEIGAVVGEHDFDRDSKSIFVSEGMNRVSSLTSWIIWEFKLLGDGESDSMMWVVTWVEPEFRT